MPEKLRPLVSEIHYSTVEEINVAWVQVLREFCPSE